MGDIGTYSKHIDKTFSTMRLIGRFNCCEEPTKPDLDVYGGCTCKTRFMC